MKRQLSGLRSRADDVVEEGLAKREFPWVVVQMKALLVHRVGEPDPVSGSANPNEPPAPGVPNALPDEPKVNLGKGLM